MKVGTLRPARMVSMKYSRLTIASASRSSALRGMSGEPGSIMRRTCAVMRSSRVTARDCSSISSAAVTPFIRPGTASASCGSTGPETRSLTASRTRAMLCRHSRSNASVTSRISSACSSGASSSASGSSSTSPTSRWSRRSSTRSRLAATLNSSSSVCSRSFSRSPCSRSASPCTWSRMSPRPSTPSVSPILPSMLNWLSSTSLGMLPVRACRSSASLTRDRSSRIAAATVCISCTLGPPRLSRASATSSWSGSSSPRLKVSRMALTRLPRVVERAT